MALADVRLRINLLSRSYGLQQLSSPSHRPVHLFRRILIFVMHRAYIARVARSLYYVGAGQARRLEKCARWDIEQIST